MVYNFSEKKGLLSLLKNRGFYAIAGLCLVAAGTGVLAARQSAVTNPPQTTAPPAAESRSAIAWDDGGTQASSAVNKPASDVPDERDQASTSTTTKTTTTKPNPNTPFTGDFTLPFGTDIMRDYSNGELVYLPTMDDWRSHDGVDFGGAVGNDVLAVQDGKVKKVYTDELWGTVVELDHGNGFVASYRGLDAKSALPKEGASVERGAVIGKLGEIPCEAMDQPHLHFEAMVNGKIQDPLAVLNKLGEQN
ncbi:MAG: M23 family metallopeptidase [Clostridium sp.]|jgi:murein DD-endopeptidase MepM/ murein hydrolase activator NlpD|nr:M23 family metallopeptidase [Clostridium sp.]